MIICIVFHHSLGDIAKELIKKQEIMKEKMRLLGRLMSYHYIIIAKAERNLFKYYIKKAKDEK